MTQALTTAQVNLRQGENPERQVVRFALDLATSFLQQSYEQSSKTGGVSAALST
jgi:hypothetical protein